MIFFNEKYILPRDKIEKYLLKFGAKHANEFFDVGYTENDIDRLNQDIYEQFDEGKFTEEKKQPEGATHFIIYMMLGVGDKKKRFRTVWRKDTPLAKPRFITAHRM